MATAWRSPPESAEIGVVVGMFLVMPTRRAQRREARDCASAEEELVAESRVEEPTLWREPHAGVDRQGDPGQAVVEHEPRRCGHAAGGDEVRLATEGHRHVEGQRAVQPGTRGRADERCLGA